jgi:translation initiation factor 2B subunit (eIF-2B alpha/beta/delta family)
VLSLVAAEGLDSEIRDLPTQSLESFYSHLLPLAREIRQSQPAMAPLFHLTNDVLLAAERAKTRREALSRIRSATRGYMRSEKTLAARAVRRALALIPAGATVLTHSASSLVEAVLLSAARPKRGKQARSGIRAICTESRPAGEGRQLALRLGSAGIRTTLIIDAAAGEALDDADLLLVGADTVTSKGLIHKVGTCVLATLARKQKVPCFAVATSRKLLPDRFLLDTWNLTRAAKEVTRVSHKNLTVLNRPFDLTPWKWLTGVVTEEGLLSRKDVVERLKRIRLAKGWA